MKIMHLPPEPFYYIGRTKMASDGNYVIFCDLDEITSMGSSKMAINDYLITDPDMFKALLALLEGTQVENVPDERLSLLFFEYLEAKYPTYSFT